MMPKRPEPPDNVDSWLMSYADMITLLLCFFIIFVSVSEPKKDKLDAVTRGMVTKFGSVDLSTPVQGLYKSLASVVESQQLLKDVAVSRDKSAIGIELSAPAFFKPNSAELSDDKLTQLTALAKALKDSDVMDYHIRIECYTSDAKAPGQYASNWDFSSARAARMVRFLIDSGINQEHLEAVGMGDTHPKVDNEDSKGNAIPENRQKNERVVITLEHAL